MLLRKQRIVKIDNDFNVYYQGHDEEGAINNKLRKKAQESLEMSIEEFLKMMET